MKEPNLDADMREFEEMLELVEEDELEKILDISEEEGEFEL